MHVSGDGQGQSTVLARVAGRWEMESMREPREGRKEELGPLGEIGKVSKERHIQ